MFLCTGAESADGLLFNLTDALAGKSELRADLFKRHLWLVDTIESLYHTTFTFVEYLEGVVDFCLQRLHKERAVGHRGIVIDKHIKQAVVFAVNEGRINGYMAGVHTHGLVDLVLWKVQRFGDLLD